MITPAVKHSYQAPSDEAVAAYYDALRQFWHPVLPSSELADHELRGVELLEEQLVLARLDGQLVAMQDLCRHFQAQLSLGEVRAIRGAGECIMCPYHGWSYNRAGQCVDIPQLAAGRVIPAGARVPVYQAQERYGLIWVCLAEDPTFPLPALPGLNDRRFVHGPLRVYEPWVSSLPRAIMAALDDTHAAWVHEGLLGDRTRPAPPDRRVRRDGQHLISEFTMLQPENKTIADGKQHAALREVAITTTVAVPNVIHFDIRAVDTRDQRHTLIWQAVAPRRYNLIDTYWGSARNYDLDRPAHDEQFEAMQDVVRAQDRRIVEGQRPWLLPPFWTKIELPMRPADVPLIEYQQWLEELGVTTAI